MLLPTCDRPLDGIDEPYELRAANREMRNAYEEHRQAQQALIDMYRHRERERDNLQRDH